MQPSQRRNKSVAYQGVHQAVHQAVHTHPPPTGDTMARATVSAICCPLGLPRTMCSARGHMWAVRCRASRSGQGRSRCRCRERFFP